MGNSPSAAPAAPAAPAASNASAPAAPSTSSPNAKNNTKTVVQVPAENVTISKGGKRRRLRGGVASVRFDMVPHFQPSEAVMQHATTAMPSTLKGGKRRRSHKRKTHKRRTSRK
jgi:3-oxoacyl-ACP reductase-like protein